MTEKRYIIDVEDENYENAVFCGEEFICYEDDSEQLVNELNKLSSDKELLNIDYKNCLDYNRTLINENEQLKQQIESYKKVIEDCDNLFCKYGVDTSNLQAVEELFKTLDSDGDVE